MRSASFSINVLFKRPIYDPNYSRERDKALAKLFACDLAQENDTGPSFTFVKDLGLFDQLLCVLQRLDACLPQLLSVEWHISIVQTHCVALCRGDDQGCGTSGMSAITATRPAIDSIHALFPNDRNHHQRRHRIGPPPAQQRIQ
jgi:hypothetical protein